MRKLLYMLVFTALISGCKKEEEAKVTPINKEYYFTYLVDGTPKFTYDENAIFTYVNDRPVLKFTTKEDYLNFEILDMASFDVIKKGEYIISANDYNQCGAKVNYKSKNDFKVTLDEQNPINDGKKIYINNVYDFAEGYKVIEGKIDDVQVKGKEFTDIDFKLLVERKDSLVKEVYAPRIKGFLQAEIGGEFVKRDILLTDDNEWKDLIVVLASYDNYVSNRPEFFDAYNYYEPGMALTFTVLKEIVFQNAHFSYNRIVGCTLEHYEAAGFTMEITNIVPIDTRKSKVYGTFYGSVRSGSKTLQVNNGTYEFEIEKP